MASPQNTIKAVLAHFPPDCQPRAVEDLAAAGGFSGAKFWRIDAPRGPLCLRRWPVEHPDRSRLGFIHDVIRHVANNGFSKVPAPISPLSLVAAPLDTASRETRATASGSPETGSPAAASPENVTFVFFARHFWELTPWLPGTADYLAKPNRARLQKALNALAEFHRAAASFPKLTGRVGPAPAIGDRLQITRCWLKSDLDRLAAAKTASDAAEWPELFELGSRIIQRFRSVGPLIADQLAGASELPVPIQPCIRDVWEQHVLFKGDEVSGIVDFGAMRPDTVSTDIARLIGSMAKDCHDDWKTAIGAYCEVRPLSDNERQLIAVLDRSQVALSGLNWLRWHYLDGRKFAQRSAIETRLRTTLRRLSRLS